MNEKLRIVKIDSNYCNYLREYDKRVIYNMGEKELRPFVGILFKINDLEYFAPLSSPKPKHLKMKNSIDFFKIKDGELGAVNFNNMIPVNKKDYSFLDLDNKPKNVAEIKYQKLLKEQINWLNENYIQVKNKSYKLYNLYKNDKLGSNIKSRCCNFTLLEEISDTYSKGSIKC